MIRITRKRGGIGRLSAYKIYINRGCEGEIWLGETREFPVKNGEYTVYVSAGYSGVTAPLLPWAKEYRSKPLDIVVNDSIVELEVGNAVTGWKNWLFPYSDIFIKKDEFLFLREKKLGEEPQGKHFTTPYM